MKKPSLNLPFLSILIIAFSSFLKLSYQQVPINPRLLKAYTALQAWKLSITSDPNAFTANWNGFNVCNYTGVYCAPAPDNPHATTVAGIDLNHAGISSTLPEELGLLTDLALFHINSNRFCGRIPDTFHHLHLLHELDVSNNELSGEFPYVVLSLPSLKFLDIRFNQFSGKIPSQLFDLKLDALFINNNNFGSPLPGNIGNSPVSVLVLANNNFRSCFPSTLSKMKDTLNQVILMNTGLAGCLPPEIGWLTKLSVFDVSYNQLVGSLPDSMGKMQSLEQLNVAHNKLSGVIPYGICDLPQLENFTYSYNYFTGEPPVCLKLPDKDDRENCIPNRPLQRSAEGCKSFYAKPIDCGSRLGCPARSPPPSPPPPPSPSPPPQKPHYSSPAPSTPCYSSPVYHQYP